MGILNTNSNYFSLDIGTTAVRAVYLRPSSDGLQLMKYGSRPLSAAMSQTEATQHRAQLLTEIQALVKDLNLPTNNVVVGLPTDRVFVTVVDLPKLTPKELEKNIELQADQYIPDKIDDSKLDYAVLGDSPVDPSKAEVLLASTKKAYVEKQLDMLESIGLNVIAMEPDAFALGRSLIDNNQQEAVMVVEMGANSTDLVVQYRQSPRLVRTIPIGGETLTRATTKFLNIDDKQANQFIYKFGLMEDKLEGQVFSAIKTTIDSLVNDIEKSINFFRTRYKDVPITKIIVTGRASILPDFPIYLVNRTNISVEIGNSWRNVKYPQEKYNDLMAASNQYAVAVGLAERKR